MKKNQYAWMMLVALILFTSSCGKVFVPSKEYITQKVTVGAFEGIEAHSTVKVIYSQVSSYQSIEVSAPDNMMEYVAKIYIKALNAIHYMHDKYAYEASQMALHDTAVERLMAFGIAGFSCAVDSLSAIKYAKVKTVRDENGIAIDFAVDGEYPKFGNDDDKVDNIAKELLEKAAKFHNIKYSRSRFFVIAPPADEKFLEYIYTNEPDKNFVYNHRLYKTYGTEKFITIFKKLNKNI